MTRNLLGVRPRPDLFCSSSTGRGVHILSLIAATEDREAVKQIPRMSLLPTLSDSWCRVCR